MSVTQADGITTIRIPGLTEEASATETITGVPDPGYGVTNYLAYRTHNAAGAGWSLTATTYDAMLCPARPVAGVVTGARRMPAIPVSSPSGRGSGFFYPPLGKIIVIQDNLQIYVDWQAPTDIWFIFPYTDDIDMWPGRRVLLRGNTPYAGIVLTGPPDLQATRYDPYSAYFGPVYPGNLGFVVPVASIQLMPEWQTDDPPHLIFEPSEVTLLGNSGRRALVCRSARTYTTLATLITGPGPLWNTSLTQQTLRIENLIDSPQWAMDVDCPAPWGNLRIIYTWSHGYVLSSRGPAWQDPVRHPHVNRRWYVNTFFRAIIVSSQADPLPLFPANAANGFLTTDTITDAQVFPQDLTLGNDWRGALQDKLIEITAQSTKWVGQSWINNAWVDVIEIDGPNPQYVRSAGAAWQPGFLLQSRSITASAPMLSLTLPDVGSAPFRMQIKASVTYTGYDVTSTTYPYAWQQYTKTATWTGTLDGHWEGTVWVYRVRRTEVGAYPYFPYDIPHLQLAEDDDECRFVTHVGYVP